MDTNNLIAKMLEDVDVNKLVKEVIKSEITTNIRSTINEIISKNANDLILKEITSVIKNPIETDDGWGNTKKYTTFKDLFKKELREKLNDSYQIRRTIENIVKDYVNKLFNEEYKNTVNNILESIVIKPENKREK